MSPTVHLRTRNKKYVFLVMAMLSFARKFPEKTLTVPLKMLKLLYGTGVGNQPLKGLRDLTWETNDVEALPVFERIEPDVAGKPTKIEVVFRPELLAAAATMAPADYQRGLFSDVADVGRAAFALAEREMLGDLRDWTIPNLVKAYRSRVLAAQTATGSCVPRYVRICPLCGHGMVRLFYGTAQDYRDFLRTRKEKPEDIILGSPSDAEPQPRWMCAGCGLKLWQAASNSPKKLTNDRVPSDNTSSAAAPDRTPP